MKNEELELEIKENEECLRKNNSSKRTLEELVVVKDYLELVELIEAEQKYQLFLNQLEVGEDGTVFDKHQDIIDKSSTKFHFGLSKTLKYALGFIQRFNYEDYHNFTEYFRLPYDRFQEYLNNAISILNDMNYYEGDRIVENQYGLEIYENPKNYSVVDFQKLMPLTDKQFRANYHLKSIVAGKDCFVSMGRGYLTENDLESLSTREYEAFFGKEAQRILGYSEPKILKKTNVD